jgi:predicted Zn-dependent protease
MFNPDKSTQQQYRVGPLIILLSITLAGAALNPAAGKKPKAAEKAQSSRQVEDRFGLYNNEFLLRYVDSVGRALNAQLPTREYNFRFRIVDQAEPNIFTFPSGHIYLSRGLLAQINTEDELAAILAHAISHITLGHSSPKTQTAVQDQPPTLPETALGTAMANDLRAMMVQSPGTMGAKKSAASTPEQELEADQAGIELTARAGYDPSALGDALDRISRAVELMTDIQASGFFDPYPVTARRLANIRDLAARIEWTPGKPFARDKAALMKRLDGLRWGNQIPANGVFQGRTFVHSGLNIAITFPEGWRLENTPNYVGGFERNARAMIVFGGAGRSTDPSVLAQVFISRIAEEIDISPDEAREVEIGDWPAYVVRFEDASGTEPVSLYFLWVTSPGATYQLIGFGADEFRDPLGDAVLSLHHPTAEEREAIVNYRLRIVEAQAGESLTELKLRSGNLLSDELTSIVNGLPMNELLGEGALIKVVRAEAFRR